MYSKMTLSAPLKEVQAQTLLILSSFLIIQRQLIAIMMTMSHLWSLLLKAGGNFYGLVTIYIIQDRFLGFVTKNSSHL